MWGQKQEYTETWYGLFSKDGKFTEATDALKTAWSKSNPTTATPTIDSMLLNGLNPSQNVHLLSNSRHNVMRIKQNLICYGLSDCSIKDVKVSWKILAESTDKKAGGDVESEAEEVKFNWKWRTPSEIAFNAPSNKGAYRLFVTLTYKNKVAYANFPFFVDENPEKGNGKKIWIKKWEMRTFNEE